MSSWKRGWGKKFLHGNTIKVLMWIPPPVPLRRGIEGGGTPLREGDRGRKLSIFYK